MLTLPIKKCWFDLIVSGVKNEEYRDCTDYYLKRFHHLKMTMVDGKAQTFIRLRNGYGRNAPSCLIRCWMDMGEGRVEWGATPGKQYIRLHITTVNVERRNNDYKQQQHSVRGMQT